MVKEFEQYTMPLDENLKHPLCKAIVGVLKGSHKGKTNSIKAEPFSALLSDIMGREINVRTLRAGISELRMHGEPICSWCRGYYYLNTMPEFNLTIQSLTDRMIALAAEVLAMSDRYEEFYEKRPKLIFKDLRCNIDKLIPMDVDQKNIENNN